MLPTPFPVPARWLHAGLVALACAVPALATPQLESVSVDYVLRIGNPADELVDVRVSIHGLAPERERLTLAMTEGFAFVRLGDPLLGAELGAVTPAGPRSVTRSSPYRWTVATGGAPELELSYRLPLTHRSLRQVAGRHEYEYPYLAADHGLLVTGALLVRPVEVSALHWHLRLELPAGWAIHAPWPEVEPGVLAAPDEEALANDLIAVGAWERVELQVEKFAGLLAVAPGQAGLMASVAPLIRRIIAAELQLFGRTPDQNYAFFFGRPDVQGFAGSPKSHAMTLAISPELQAGAPGMVAHLIAHEFFHTWAAASFSAPDELRWWNEGVTDYYAYRILAELGYKSWNELGEDIASRLRQIELARDRTSLVAAGGDDFFQVGLAHDTVYRGGFLVGAWLDRSLRAQGVTDGLDPLMRAFVNAEREPGARPDLAEFVSLVRAVGGDELADQLRRHVEGRLEPEALVAGLTAAGVTVERELISPELALQANLGGNVVGSIDPDGLGWRVGLRQGDELFEVNGVFIESAADVQQAWVRPTDGVMRVVLARAGEEVFLEEPLRDEPLYRIDAKGWMNVVPVVR